MEFEEYKAKYLKHLLDQVVNTCKKHYISSKKLIKTALKKLKENRMYQIFRPATLTLFQGFKWRI